MPRRARISLIGAALGAVAMALTYVAAHDITLVRHADADILGGFLSLHRPTLNRVTSAIANLCDPVPWVLFAGIPIIVALVRGRPRLALMLAVVLLGANATTEILKPLLAGARDPVAGIIVSPRSWPSGHATAVMSLALAAVIAAPARRRPLVGGLMAAGAVAVCYSFLELGWHYPSDVLGGFLVAGIWTLLGVAALSLYEARRPALAPRAAVPRPSLSVGQALGPPLAIVGAGILFAAVVALSRPHAVLAYAGAHAALIVGATAIAALSFAFASGLGLMLRRPS